MLISIENKCLICNRIFCCPKCRLKHELIKHKLNKISTESNKKKINTNCLICLGKKLTFQKYHSVELINHLVSTHLPLKCNKCSQMFTKESDFHSIAGCHMENCCEIQRIQQQTNNDPISVLTNQQNNNADNKNINQKNPENNLQKNNLAYNNNKDMSIGISNAVAVSPSSMISDIGINKSDKLIITPVSQWNEMWKNKSYQKHIRDQYISSNSTTDNLSSIRNVSPLLNNTSALLHKTVSPRKNLVRQTSTPMHPPSTIGLGGGGGGGGGGSSTSSNGSGNSSGGTIRIINRDAFISYNKPHSFDSMNQMSTINHSISSTNNDSDSSPPLIPPTKSCSSSVSPKQRRSRKLPPSATPLRQVMSKSIQKAIVQHGFPQHIYLSKTQLNDTSSVGGGGGGDRSSGNSTNKLTTSPQILDLRLSPAIRRLNENDTKTISSSIISSSKFLVSQSSQPPEPLSPPKPNTTQHNSINLIIFSPILINNLNSNANIVEINNTNNNNNTKNNITPCKKPISDHYLNETKNSNDSGSDIWFTPCSLPVTPVPKQLKCRKIDYDSYNHLNFHSKVDMELTKYQQNLEDNNNQLYKENNNEIDKIKSSLSTVSNKKPGSLWSIVSSVFKLATFGNSKPTIDVPLQQYVQQQQDQKQQQQKHHQYQQQHSTNYDSSPASFRNSKDNIKRAVSFAGQKLPSSSPMSTSPTSPTSSLYSHNSNNNDYNGDYEFTDSENFDNEHNYRKTQKRRRSNTFGGMEILSKRPKRIQGRPPIDRMRKNKLI